MNARHLFSVTPCIALALAGIAAGCTQFRHVAPGQSVLVSQAKKPIAYSTPTPKPSLESDRAFTIAQVLPDLPHSEPLPATSMADFYSLGNTYLQEGRNAEAAAAFKKATELDPTYAEAWHNLALSYESAGDESDALEAFRRYKNLPSGQ